MRQVQVNGVTHLQWGTPRVCRNVEIALGVTQAVVVLVAGLSRGKYWFADRLGFWRSGGSLAYAAVPLGL